MSRQHLTEDERSAILDSYRYGEKMSAIAAAFEVNEKTVYRVWGIEA